MEKVDLITQRTNFFNQIVEMLERKPDETDRLMKQEPFYVSPSQKIINPEKGELLLCFPVTFYGKNFNVWYSFWQYSFEFKIGIFVEDPKLENAFMTDPHREIKFVWGSDLPPRFDNSRGTVMYEWEFRVPRLFDSYIYQEKYILGSRHMHFRLMRVLHDECLILHKKVNPMSGLKIL